MGQKELNRIVEQRLSPLYISVHTTDKQLRRKLFLYKKDDHLLSKIKFLTENDIVLHCQIVLMPTINDQYYLIKTIKDLYQLEVLILEFHLYFDHQVSVLDQHLLPQKLFQFLHKYNLHNSQSLRLNLVSTNNQKYYFH